MGFSLTGEDGVFPIFHAVFQYVVDAYYICCTIVKFGCSCCQNMYNISLPQITIIVFDFLVFEPVCFTILHDILHFFSEYCFLVEFCSILVVLFLIVSTCFSEVLLVLVLTVIKCYCMCYQH